MAGRGRGAVVPAWMQQGSAAPGSADAGSGGTGAGQDSRAHMGTWTEHTAPDGRKYYYNAVLKKSSWEKPPVFESRGVQQGSEQMHVGHWEEHRAPDGRKYYYNPITKQSKWSLPPGVMSVVKSRGQQGYVCPPGAVQPGPTPTYATTGEAQEAFKSLLRDAQIPSWMAWEQALGIISVDRRFGALRVMAERKAMFEEYRAQLIQEEEGQEQQRKKELEDVFFSMLDSCAALASAPAGEEFQIASEHLKHDERWMVVSTEAEREELLDKWMQRKAELREKEIEARRIQGRESFMEYLRRCEWMQLDTTWRKAQHQLEDVEEFSNLEKIDQVEVFDEFMLACELKFEQLKTKEAEDRKVRERKNRLRMRRMLEQQLQDGMIHAKMTWKEYLRQSSEDEVVKAVEKNLGGSRPKELFLDIIEKAEETYESELPLIEKTLNQSPLEISNDSPTLEEFTRHIRQNMHDHAISISSMKLFLLEKQSYLKSKKEEKASKFFAMLRECDVSADATYEEVSIRCEKQSVWQEFSDTERQTLLQEFQNTYKNESHRDTGSDSRRRRGRRESTSRPRSDSEDSDDDRYRSRRSRRSRRGKRSRRRSRSLTRSRSRSLTRSRSRSRSAPKQRKREEKDEGHPAAGGRDGAIEEGEVLS